MDLRKPILALGALMGVTLVSWIAIGQQGQRVDDAVLKSAGKTGQEWVVAQFASI
jgi:hypothetical protein